MTDYVSTRLTDTHDVAAFRCGNETLDAWLHHIAARAQRAGIARVTVWTPSDDPARVVAYYAVAPAVMTSTDGLPRKATAGFTSIPVWLLGKLAVDVGFQGQGIGRDLLVDAIETIVSIATASAGRLIVVDPIDAGAATWYQRFGFTPFGDPAESHPSRLYMIVDRALRSLAR